MTTLDEFMSVGSPVARRNIILVLLIAYFIISIGKLNLDATILFDGLKLRYILAIIDFGAIYWMWKAKA